MSFKDQIVPDLDVFFNECEFAGQHIINGRPITAIVDNDRLMERSRREFDGISVGEMLILVRAAEYGERPGQGAPVNFDGRPMYVFDAREDDEVYEIILQQNRSG